jgi:hypothetical protein
MDMNISIDESELDEVLIEGHILVLKCTFNCYCYDISPRQTEYYILQKEDKSDITYRDAIKCLEDNNFTCNCNHTFLEGFDRITDIQYSPCLFS